MSVDVTIDGSEYFVQFLDGKPWYVCVRTFDGTWRATWHRDHNKPYGRMTARVIRAARAKMSTQCTTQGDA